MSKSDLAIILSKLKDFGKYDIKLEQYSTPSEIAADIVWKAYMFGDIKGRIVLDAACGPGFFGVGALLLKAKKVYFVDLDKEAANICKENLRALKLKGVVEQKPIEQFNRKVDTVLQNPPFGTKKKHEDKIFLEKAFDTANIIYSVHKTATKPFVEAIAVSHNFKITHKWNYDFRLKPTLKFHRKKFYIVKASCFRIKRKDL